MLSILEEKKIHRGIIVFPGNMTPSARKVSRLTNYIPTSDSSKVIVAMASQYRLEEFSESDLLVNIVHHTLVPMHNVLSPDQKKMLLQK